MKHFFVLILLVSSTYLSAQNQFAIDSLQMLYNKTKEDTSKVKLLWEIAKKTDNYLKGTEYTEKAIGLVKQKELDDHLAMAYYHNGSILILLGSYDTALDNFLKAIKIAKQQGDRDITFRILNNIGTVYDRIGRFDEALDYYVRSLEVYYSMTDEEKERNKNKLGYSYNNIGCIYMTREDFNTSETYFLKGLDLSNISKNKTAQGMIYNNMGKLYMMQNNYKKAFDYINKSLIIREEVGDKKEIVKSYFYLTVYYTNIGEYDKASEAATKAYGLSKDVGSLEWTKWITKYIFKIQKKKGEYENALIAHEEYKAISDSLVNEKIITDMARTKMQYEFEKEEVIRNIEQKRTRLIFISVITLFVLTTVIVGLLYILAKNRGKRIFLENDRLEKDLELKNKELTTNVMYLLKKNEFMNDISSRLVDIIGRVKGDNKQVIKQVVYDLQSAADEDVWEEFEIRFQQVHNDFFIKLKEISPELTPSELKICAFLRLNMKTKEISAITHLSVRTIEVTRSNIRKKLNLTHSDVNLISYLNEF